MEEMPRWRKGKREGQKSLNASEEQGDNAEGPQQASGFNIQSIQQVDFFL